MGEQPVYTRQVGSSNLSKRTASDQQGRLVVPFIGRYQLNTTTVVSVL